MIILFDTRDKWMVLGPIRHSECGSIGILDIPLSIWWNTPELSTN